MLQCLTKQEQWASDVQRMPLQASKNVSFYPQLKQTDQEMAINQLCVCVCVLTVLEKF